MESSLSGSCKRAKAPGNVSSSQVVVVAHCLVDGCNADLSVCREYHRRHKVCEPHSKASKVTIEGRDQRFCQQCSRFHSLSEFDEGKRSCRKRLDGHNRRRRKPQPEIPRNSGLLFSTSQGTRVLSFSSCPSPQQQQQQQQQPQMIFPSAVVSCTWAAGHVVKPPESSGGDMLAYNKNNQSNMSYVEEMETTFSAEPSSSSSSSVHGYNKLGVNQFQLIDQQQHEVASICKPVLDQNSRSGGGNHNHTNSGQKKKSCDGLNQVDGALSLLSSAPAVTVTSKEITGFGTTIPMVLQPDSSISQSSLLLHNNSPCHFPFAPPPPETETFNKSETRSQVSCSNTITTTLHFQVQDMFHQNGPPPPPPTNDDDDESSTTTTGSHHHTHTFLWE